MTPEQAEIVLEAARQQKKAEMKTFFHPSETQCPKCHSYICNRVLTPMLTNHPKSRPDRVFKILGNKIECKCPRCGAYWVGTTVIERGIEACVSLEEVVGKREKAMMQTRIDKN